jgi:hypothetical protein
MACRQSSTGIMGGATFDGAMTIDKYIYKYLAQLLNVCIIEIE